MDFNASSKFRCVPFINISLITSFYKKEIIKTWKIKHTSLDTSNSLKEREWKLCIIFPKTLLNYFTWKKYKLHFWNIISQKNFYLHAIFRTRYDKTKTDNISWRYLHFFFWWKIIFIRAFLKFLLINFISYLLGDGGIVRHKMKS